MGHSVVGRYHERTKTVMGLIGLRLIMSAAGAGLKRYSECYRHWRVVPIGGDS